MDKPAHLVLILLLTTGAFILGNMTSQYWSVQSLFSSASPSTVFKAQPLPTAGGIPVPQPHAPQQAQLKLGESFALDDIEYTIKSASQEPCNFMCDKSAKQILVKFSAENTGTKSADFAIMNVIDSAGRQYAGRGWYVTTGGLPETSLKPGFSGSFDDEFEVAAKSSGLKLLLAHQSGQVVDIVPLGI